MYRIKSLRLENHLSQAGLAQRIGSSQKAVDYWEKGTSEPTARFIIAMADCFGCSTDYILGREDDFGNINVDSDLKTDEKEIIEMYRSFSKDKKHQLKRFAEFISADK